VGTGEIVRVLEGNTAEVNVVLFVRRMGNPAFPLSRVGLPAVDVATGRDTTPVTTFIGAFRSAWPGSRWSDRLCVYAVGMGLNMQQFESEFWLEDPWSKKDWREKTIARAGRQPRWAFI